MNKRRGFTMIELLVVIAVIAILSAVVLAAISTVRVNSRNVRRARDAKELMSAFNVGLSGASNFPISASATWICVSTSCYGGFSSFVADTTVDAALLANMSAKPTDPNAGVRGYGGYLYYYNWAGGAAPYDGYVFPVGSVIRWMAEAPVKKGICGAGRIYSTTATYVECIEKLY